MRVPLRTATLVALLVVVSASSSWALIENLLPGGANVTMKFQDWDAGTRYSNLVVGKTYTDAELAALPTVDPGDGSAFKTLVPGFEGEDGFGIFRLTDIYDTNTLASYYNWLVQPFEITGLFWGLDDQSVLFNGTTQFIKSNNLSFAFFEDTTPDFAPGAPGSRVGDTFPTVTDGTCIWTGNSVVGDPYADPYEFYAEFNPGVIADPKDDAGKGEFMANSGAVPTWGAGTLNWMIGDFLPGTNWKFQFTADTNGAGDWPLASNDPGKTQITPELSTPMLMLIGMLPMGLAWWRRRKA